MPDPNKQLHPPSTSTTNSSTSSSLLLSLAFELQVHWLTYLRAYDLGVMQQTCHYYSNPVLIDATIRKFQEVYDAKEEDLLAKTVLGGGGLASPSTAHNKPKMAHKKILAAATMESTQEDETNNSTRLTFQQLRFMEMRAVARVLQRPEPCQGYFVSKSWCKHALKWLETQQQESLAAAAANELASPHNKKKISKKQLRLRQRRLSDASPPWPNANSDLLCPHNQMACSKTRSARRLDKQAWRILKKLYPDSTQLATAVGECLQCSLERETLRKHEMDQKEKEAKARKEPLQNPEIRRFYTRTRGVPIHMLREESQNDAGSEPSATIDFCDRKLPANSGPLCPLKDDTYFLLPRAWCHGWRRLIRTGQGDCGPPHAGRVLCEAHGTPLLPPHVELYLQGHAEQLLDSITSGTTPSQSQPLTVAAQGRPAIIPGQGPDEATIQALRAAGLSNAEVNQQLAAMLSMEQQRLQQLIRPPPAAPAAATNNTLSKNELLDRENHVVVEIVTLAEYTALEQLYAGGSFGVGFVVTNGCAVFETSPCRKCDATGRHCNVTLRNRSLRNPRKGAASASTTTSAGNDKSLRAGATLEY